MPFHRRLGCTAGALVALPHPGVHATSGGELSVRSALDNHAGIEHENLIGAGDCVEPVRDHEERALARQLGERGLDRRLRIRVREGGRLVEHEDGGIGEQRSCDCESLRLAARQVRVFANDGVVAAWELEYAIVDLRGARGAPRPVLVSLPAW